jgi:hypothetical protein
METVVQRGRSASTATEKWEPVDVVLMRFLNRKVAPSTKTEWIRHGRRGVKMDAILMGGKYYTTESRVLKFFSDADAARKSEDA